MNLRNRFMLPMLVIAGWLWTSEAAAAEWKAEAKAVGNGIYAVTVTATTKAGFHIYDFGPYDGGPNPTVITFDCPQGVKCIGDLTPSVPPVRHEDTTFGMTVGFWEGTVSFTQRMECKVPSAEVGIEVGWMECDDNSCTPPDETKLTVTLTGPDEAGSTAGVENDADGQAEAGAAEADGGLWRLIIEAILWGFAALLTPCVFPIVPMTVSFFLKGDYSPSANKMRAAAYGLFIILLYTVPIGVIIAVTRLVGGDAVTAGIFNWLATHWLPNVIFFIVFMVFAASFFGAFEIMLPASLQNGSDSQADKRKGLGGVFFLALTLVLVSFSCTGPIVGTVLIKSTAGEFWTPIVTIFAFSVAFALPFVFFALFPGLMSRLPKSGGWLNSVKVVLGFVEIALGFKFLSTADQVYHWGILDREVYLAIWIVVFTLLGFYLLGKLKFRYDSDLKHIGVFRLTLAIIDFSFVVYMIPGMFGAPLKALSGYLPPLETQDFICAPWRSEALPEGRKEHSPTVKYGDFLKLPHGLQGFFDLDEATEYAAAQRKPLFIDFTGHGCVNCREMETRVWSAPEVLAMLRDDYVICALYSDDKKTLSEEEWVTTKSGKVLKTLGKKNTELALTRFGISSQPCYVLMAPDGAILNSFRGYGLDIPTFAQWLRDGLHNFGKRQ